MTQIFGGRDEGDIGPLPECPKCTTNEEVYIFNLSEFLFGCYLCGGRFDQKHYSARNVRRVPVRSDE